ncbi:MAG TPA: lipid-A-disaccharide synthase [Blastocatellia bacterium]|nr:lipid-A-disaccharide synthase [Blastocatellia bacterium]
MSKKMKIMIVAGEASGDRHAAKLVTAIRKIYGSENLEFFGAAGPLMRDAGVEPVVDSDHFSVVGLPEIGRALPMFLRAFRALGRAAREEKPDAVILVDFPDFNLKLAKSLKKQGFSVIYYISPQIWAWRKYRIRSIRKYVDLIITILPFEKEWYAAHGVENVVFVGSPLAREVHSDTDRQAVCSEYGIDPSRPIVSLLPGSRSREISRILPIMLKATERLRGDWPHAQFLVAVSEGRNFEDAERILADFNTAKLKPLDCIKVVKNRTYDALNASDAAAVTSGTATLEAGIIGTPMAIVYKTSALNYTLLRPLISVEHFGLINLIAGERVAKELIQGDFTPRKLAEEIARILDPSENALIRRRLAEATEKLGHGGASHRAAEAVLSHICGDGGI